LNLKEKRKVILNIFNQIIEAVLFLNQHGILLSCLKPQNIMIEETSQNQYKAVLIELGSGIPLRNSNQ
jgi:serine/threonine protein kinase